MAPPGRAGQVSALLPNRLRGERRGDLGLQGVLGALQRRGRERLDRRRGAGRGAGRLSLGKLAVDLDAGGHHQAVVARRNAVRAAVDAVEGGVAANLLALLIAGVLADQHVVAVAAGDLVAASLTDRYVVAVSAG